MHVREKAAAKGKEGSNNYGIGMGYREEKVWWGLEKEVDV